MTYRIVAFTAVAVLALGSGMIRTWVPERPGEAAQSTLSSTTKTRVPTTVAGTRFAPRQVPEPSQDGNSRAVRPEPILGIDSGSDQPAVDLGEPLDADDDWAREMALADEEPVDIGPPLNADDALTRESDEPSEAPRDLGELLDADDPEAWDPMETLEEPVEIGYELDAEDPEGWVADDALDVPTEIGEFLPVEGPST